MHADKLKEIVKLIRNKGLTRHGFAKKLARTQKNKIKRVVAGRTFWKELTRTLREFANYWPDYAVLKETEDVQKYHLVLEVTMPKDLAQTKS